MSRLDVSSITVEPASVVIAVSEKALAISLEQTLEAGGVSVVAYCPDLGLSGLPLSARTTLIVDRQVLPKDPRKFIEQLHNQLWRGLAIVLTEDAAAADFAYEGCCRIKLIEKPFGSADLLALVKSAG